MTIRSYARVVALAGRGGCADRGSAGAVALGGAIERRGVGGLSRTESR
jgi:hypothetical protein